MNTRLIVICSLLLLALAPATTIAASGSEEPLPELFDHLPKDPLFVWAATDLQPVEMFDGLIDLAGKFLPEEELTEMRTSLASVDEALGMSLRDDLLAKIGPEAAIFFDLPDLDQTAQQVMMGQASAAGVLGRVGYVVGTDDGAALERSLVKLAAQAGGEAIATKGLHQIRFATAPASGDPAQAAAPGPGDFIPYVDLFFRSAKGLMVIGFDEAFVESSLAGLAEEDRLIAGDDFGRVFAQLDRRPESLTYFNIPKFVGRITSSQMVGGILAANEEAAPMLEMLQSPDLTGMGAGSTSVTIDGGQRTTTYGPAFLSDTVQIGIISAIFIPNFLDALDKAKQKRTMQDMQAAAGAIEGFSLANNSYPGPTEGWVPLAHYSEVLSGEQGLPVPLEDGWGHPLMYISDGATYKLRSPGKDGVVSESDVEVAGAESAAYDEDIVVADGTFSG
jgi:general secretion pathway protein G